MFDQEDMSNDGIEDADGLDLDLMDKMTRLSIGIPTEEEDTEDNQEGAVALSAKNPLFANDRLCSKVLVLLFKYVALFHVSQSVSVDFKVRVIVFKSS